MAALGAWLCFDDEVGFSMAPPTVRTWARGGHIPVIRVRGRSQRRFAIAALACYKRGERSRLMCRPKRQADHKRGGRRSFTWTEYRDLLTAAHQQLGAPIVLMWGNLNVHEDARLQAFIDTHELDHLLAEALAEGAHLIDGCLAETGLTLTTSRQQWQ